ncbi:hypothetical protein GCM10010844_06970 [Deinococcus radiotolerans]|uniref:Uncharacterized protein n=1 Tax=Deinococcus radiotolerans TaxID=1309407 RepID=A0ABQ2FI64_9DEIO|nr:hypothetical protein GCM10010844_06970 [Deinococcus radiotolerans]
MLLKCRRSPSFVVTITRHLTRPSGNVVKLPSPCPRFARLSPFSAMPHRIPAAPHALQHTAQAGQRWGEE